MKVKLITGICLLLVIVINACQSDESIEFKRYYSSGSLVYQSHCQNCHGNNGEGLSGLIPPLTDSVYLKANKTTLACMLKYGLKEKIAVSGRSFEGIMPAAQLTPVEIAEVLTYVTNSYGNKQGVVTSDTVSTDLEKCYH